jgi:hypothetical protein
MASLSPPSICGGRLDRIAVGIEMNDLAEFEFTNPCLYLFAIADDDPDEIVGLDDCFCRFGDLLQ